MSNDLKQILSEADEDFLAKGLKLPIKVDDIMAEFNAFDWLDLQTTPSADFIESFVKRMNFKAESNLHLKAFYFKFEKAIRNLSALIEEVHASYNIPSKGGTANPVINNYYYLKYWADKKHIPVDYNETDYQKRKLFNFYTILFDIFAEKLNNYNAWEAQKK